MRSAQPWIHRHHTSSTNSAGATQCFAVASGILQAMATTWISTLWHTGHKLVCHGEGSQSLHQICRLLTHISCRQLLMVTTAEYESQQEFHLGFTFSEAFELSKSISLPQASWSHAGISSLPAGKPEGLCPANRHPLKPHRPPQLQLGQLLLHSTTCICWRPFK